MKTIKAFSLGFLLAATVAQVLAAVPDYTPFSSVVADDIAGAIVCIIAIASIVLSVIALRRGIRTIKGGLLAWRITRFIR